MLFRRDMTWFVLFMLPATTSGCSSPPVPMDPAPVAPKASASQIVIAPLVSSAPTPIVSIAKPESLPNKPKPAAVPRALSDTILAADPVATEACKNVDDGAFTRCLIAKRYELEPSAQTLALDLFDKSGHVAGVEAEHTMDGGFRGLIHIVPEWPTRQYKKHLEWVAASAHDFRVFFDKLGAKTDKTVRYRHQAIAFKFMRSVNRRTPSAYASEWSIGYNVSGSLHGSVDAVRETLFHEIFHLNDADRTDGGNWSAKRLRTVHDAILAQCGTRIACLTPYAPMPTMVRGGTYYAFQPNNGDAVHEYGAELATRYYREHRAILRNEKLPNRPFKCGPKENAEAWKLLVEEFFAGIDLTPPC